MLKWFHTLLHLPGPKELGWSEHDALGSRLATPFQEGKTWEDWEAYMKEHHPIKYFLVERIPYIVWYPLRRKVAHGWYWLKCHTLPSHRYHLLDLRGIDKVDSYTYGYMEPCEVMRLAAWACLVSYIEKGEPRDPASWATPEELAEEPIRECKREYDKAQNLYLWWTEIRLVENKVENSLYQDFVLSEKQGKEAYDIASKKWLDYSRWREEYDQAQFMRLAALRRNLWT